MTAGGIVNESASETVGAAASGIVSGAAGEIGGEADTEISGETAGEAGSETVSATTAVSKDLTIDVTRDRTPSMLPSEVGIAAAEALREIAARALGSAPIATYVEGDPLAWSVLADGGWDTIGIPEEDDGGGASLLDLVCAARVWGETCIPLPFVVSTMAKRWSVPARSAEGPVTIAVPRLHDTDPRGRAPFGGMPKVVVARALSLVGAVDDASTGAAADDALTELISPDVDGFTPSLRLAETHWASSIAPEPRLELGIVWAAEATGCAERLLELSVLYAKDRQQFGKPIGSFQAIKHRLADMRVLTEAIETAVLWAALQPEEGRAAAQYALDASVRVAESAIQVHGGMGFTWEMGLHYYLRHILTLRELVHGLWS